MNVRRRTGVSGAGILQKGKMTNSRLRPIGDYCTPNLADHITNSVAMQPKAGKSEFKKIKGTVNP